MAKQTNKPALSKTSEPQPKADKALSEAELETVSGGTSSGAKKKRDETANDLQNHWAG